MLQLPDATATVYQPQVESWVGNDLTFRYAVGILSKSSSSESFGVIWGRARTEVDRVNRRVRLEDLALIRSNFPTVADHGAAYLTELSLQMEKGPRGISLDRLEASLAATQAANNAGPALDVKNDVPRVLVSTSPAILIPIEGQPVIRPVSGASFERVINTRALILRPVGGSSWFIHVYDGWLSAPAPMGPYALAAMIPADVDPLARELADAGDVVLLDGGNANPKPTLASGAPTLFVEDAPAELVVYNGTPVWEPIPGTALQHATNTLSDVISDPTSKKIYLLISGRWYRGEDWQKGPWAFVASDALPPDFARIPPGSPEGVVLASVAGTPQAKEAAIENSIPQTASVPRYGGEDFEAAYDGPPKLAPIAGTPLQYAVNCPTPVIRVDESSWFALRAGVWYSATSTGGPWGIASEVPAVIYTIPPSSPLHYVTYAHVYGSSPEAVYVGYTPGYLGTVVEPTGVVAYGTGYEYDPWIGTTYYAAPATYGMMAQPIYNPAVGWSYGYGLGLTTAAMASSWGGAGNVYYSSGYHGYPCCGTASANVYSQYGNVKGTGTREYASTANGVSEYQSGTYHNEATGTHGNYSASQSYDPETEQRNAATKRTAETANGGTAEVQHSGGYNYETGRYSGSSSMSATGAGGSTVSSTKETQAGGGQIPGSTRETSYTDAKTGKSGTIESGTVGNDHYASADGNVYKNTGDGWQKSGADGWQKAGGDNSWANNEQHARDQGESRASDFDHGAGGGFSRGGEGSFGNHYGGGGFGDRFGEGGFRGRGGGGRRR